MAERALVVWDRSDLFSSLPVHVRLLQDAITSSSFAITCSAGRDLVKPDLLVYWSGGQTKIADTLPEDAVLLGAFNSPVLRLPAGALAGDGVLVLFSLADNEVVGVSKPFAVRKP